jgi:hypothetical protein
MTVHQFVDVLKGSQSQVFYKNGISRFVSFFLFHCVYQFF